MNYSIRIACVVVVTVFFGTSVLGRAGIGQRVIAVENDYDSACALLEGGAVKCWGGNPNGWLGLGDRQHRGDEPNEMGENLPEVDLGKGKRAISIAMGEQHKCALLEDNSIKCWGRGGVLGLGDWEARGDQLSEMGDNLPTVDLGKGREAIAVVAGSSHSCALLKGGAVKCWGYNTFGALGLGDKEDRGDGPKEMGDYLPTVDLGKGRKAVSLAAGGDSTCALLEGGSVKCWGSNRHGVLGLGDEKARGDDPGEMGDNLPTVDLGTGQKAVSISISGWRACALLDGGSVKCWGENSYGGLGLGDTKTRGDQPGEMGDNLPAVDLGTGQTAISITDSCALLKGGLLKCWGSNTSGRLGLGDELARGDEPGEMGDNLPAIELGLPVKSVSSGSNCAVLSNNAVKCWGVNIWGKLGLGDVEARGDSSNEMGDMLGYAVL